MVRFLAESKRLWLQALTIEDHLEGQFEIMSHPETSVFSKWKPHATIEQTKAHMIAYALPDPSSPWRKTYAILLRPEETSELQPSPKMVGVIGTFRQLEIGYRIHPKYWGQGLATEALGSFLNMFWGLEENAHHDHILAFVDPQNLASTRVLEKSGFKKGRLLPNQYQRSVDEEGKRSSLRCFYYDRPGTNISEGDRDWLFDREVGNREDDEKIELRESLRDAFGQIGEKR